MEIRYIEGSKNIIADTLSRMPEGLEEKYFHSLPENEIRIFLMKDFKHQKHTNRIYRQMGKLQAEDEKLGIIINRLKEDPQHSLSKSYCIHNDLLFYRRYSGDNNWLLCIPDVAINTIVWNTHSIWAHPGVVQTERKIKQYCYFNNMRRKIQNIIRTCQYCQKCKAWNVNKRGPLHPIVPTKPLQLVAVDICGTLPRARGGLKYVFAVLDCFTKYVKIYPIRKAVGKTIIKKLEDDYFNTVGVPQAILSDNGSQFTGTLWRNFLKSYDIKPIFISRFHPQANPSERIFKEMNKCMRIYCSHQQTKWVDYVEDFQESINNMPHGSTGFTPRELMYGDKIEDSWSQLIPKKKPDVELSFQKKIEIALTVLRHKAMLRKKAFDKHVGPLRQFSVGDLVLLRNHPQSSLLKRVVKKWAHIYIGPFQITSIPHDGAFLLTYPKSGKVKGLYSYYDIKPYYASSNYED